MFSKICKALGQGSSVGQSIAGWEVSRLWLCRAEYKWREKLDVRGDLGVGWSEDTHNSKARNSELYFCFFTGKAAHHVVSASGGGNRAGKIPAPTSSNIVDPEGPSECLFSAFLQATAHLCRALYRCCFSCTDVRQLMPVRLRWHGNLYLATSCMWCRGSGTDGTGLACVSQE